MKVYDILTESKQVDEGPLRFLKRTLGKNTAAGKAAQLDVELDKEVSNIYKDFYAVSKQDPNMKGMTAKGLAKFLAAKGFVSKPSAVMSYINAEPGMMRTLKKSASKNYKAGKDAAKSAGAKVTGAASKLKAKLSPQASGLTGADAQGNLDLSGGKMNSSMYSEAQIMEADVELSKGQVQKVIKRFVQQGFQKQMGSRVSKSSYGDAPADTKDATKKTSTAKKTTKAKDTSKADAKDMATPTMDIESAKKFLQANGYTVTKKKAKKDPADVNSDGKVSPDEKSRANYSAGMDRIRANSKK